MSLTMTQPSLSRTTESIADEQLSLLACTFEDSAEPVWIHDLADRCLYCNPSASGKHPGPTAMRFHVLDHEGNPRVRVTTLAA